VEGRSAPVTPLTVYAKGGGLAGRVVVAVAVGAVVVGTDVDEVVVVESGRESFLFANRPAPPDEPHAEADSRTAAVSAYRMDDRRKELEADMTEAPGEPRRRRPILFVATLAIPAFLAACSSSVRSSTEATSRSTTAASGTTLPATTQAPATTTTTPTTAAHPTTTTSRPPATTVKPAAVASGCAASLAGQLASTGSARQLVTVEGSSYGAQTATVTLWQRSGSCWAVAGGPWSGFVGYNGFSDHKREGDGTTPTGAYGFGSVVYGNAADPGVHETYHQLVCGDWWDENSSSAPYNTFEHVACGTTPSWASGSEALWTETQPYPSFAVIDYNTSPVIAGAGSAIFLHASTGGPTVGCVSIPLADLDTFLRWMQPSQSPLIVIGPASEITRF
jgi:L,D-peptidoglycan transpeptidase YkuD (ErfK/YbiS/YcfS/YnhG family)